MRFADDTSKEELLDLLKRVKEAGKSHNLLLNTQQTKIMVVDKCRKMKERVLCSRWRENGRN